MGRKSAMAFPHHSPSDGAASAPFPVAAGTAALGSAARSAAPAPRCHPQSAPQIEGEHQLEKLEFALAVALTRGDQNLSRILRDQIEALGGNQEEPGT